MKKIIHSKSIFIAFIIFVSTIFGVCNFNATENEENEEYDGPDKAIAFEFMRTKDPSLNRVPTERLLIAQEQTAFAAARAPINILGSGNWIERGPDRDAVGPSNGNSRPNNDVTAGRIRAILVDASDATGKTVFVGGADGGLWKTTDISISPANWTLVDDFLSNLSVTSICQDPTNKDIMYFSSGEAYYNADAVAGAGVFKSVDHGVTWTPLPSTSTYYYTSKILCDYLGNIYLATAANGLLRSTKASGGAAWTVITPTGMGNRICDLEISSTTAAGRLHVVGGIFSAQSYQYADNPETVVSASFTTPTTPFPSFNNRAEIAVSGNVLYALPADNSAAPQVPKIYKSTNGGNTWVATTDPPTGWASGQAWYALAVAINPANTNECIIGGLDSYKTTNGGTTWNKISSWYATSGQYVHADIHNIQWYDNGNKLLFGCDGGIHFSADKGVTIRDRNIGLRIKQFYSVAVHPNAATNPNYFLAGAQDNGVHQFSRTGMGSSVEVNGGDGCFVHIDQNEPQYQFTSYVHNQYNRSTDGGASWTGVNISSTTGQFINPTDYDDVANVMYCSNSPGTYLRWTNPQTGSTNQSVTITALGGKDVSAVTVSPYTTNRVYFGTFEGTALAPGKVCYVNNAKLITSGSAGVSISTGLPVDASVSCIATGTSDNNLMVSYSNYGVQNIWISTNNGTAWTNVDGNLPDMPVRWCMFAPGDNSKAIIATETGVWVTQSLNGAATVWYPSPGFPAVRTDMLQYRSADGLLVAATHGRGLWTQSAASVLPLYDFKLMGNRSGNNVSLNWKYENQSPNASFEIETSSDAVQFSKQGVTQSSILNNYNYNFNVINSNLLYCRVKVTEQNGTIKYSNTIRLSSVSTNKDLSIFNIYPNPVADIIGVNYSTNQKGVADYAVYNTTGQLMWYKQEGIRFAGNHHISESVYNLPTGNYIFAITINGKKSTASFYKR
jgi:trimeric autotransporter adhesin